MLHQHYSAQRKQYTEDAINNHFWGCMLAIGLLSRTQIGAMLLLHQPAGVPVSLAECHAAVPGCHGGTSGESCDNS